MAVAFKKQAHPYLDFNMCDLQKAKEKILAGGEAERQFKRMIAEAEDTLAEQFVEEAYANAAHNQHGNYYDIGKQLARFVPFILLDYVTGDKKYFSRVREALLFYSEYKTWTGPANAQRKTPWHCDLVTTKILNSFCPLYDYFYSQFSDEDNKKIKTAMIKKGVEPLFDDWVNPEKRIHALDSMGHNWWAVCVSSCGTGVLTLYNDIKGAGKKLSLITEALCGYCEYKGQSLVPKSENYDADGMFYEGAGYFSYGTSELLKYAHRLYRATGNSTIQKQPDIKNIAHAIMSMAYPVCDKNKPLLLTNFGDCDLSGATVTALNKYLILNGMAGDANRYQYSAYAGKWDIYDFLNDELRNAPQKSAAFAEYKNDEIYPDSGYAFLRDSWEDNATLLAVKCGFTWNHAHEDAASFILFDRGTPLLVDSGKVNYSNKNYIPYFVRARAHNVVTINGKGQFEDNIYRGTRFPGEITAFENNGWLKYILLDATGPMCDKALRNYRSILDFGGGVYVILDDLFAYNDATFKWNIHFYGAGEIDANVLKIKNENSSVDIHNLYPKNIVVREHYAPLSVDYKKGGMDDEYLYYGIKSSIPRQIQQFLNVILLNDARKASVCATQGDGFIGADITFGKVKYSLYFNLLADGRVMHENSNNKLGGYDTDAYLLAIKTEEGKKSIFAVSASYIRNGENVLHTSFKKENLTVEGEI